MRKPLNIRFINPNTDPDTLPAALAAMLAKSIYLFNTCTASSEGDIAFSKEDKVSASKADKVSASKEDNAATERQEGTNDGKKANSCIYEGINNKG